MEGHRGERVAEAIREELEELISWEMEDPRVGSVIVVDVVLSPDLRKARVMVRPMDKANGTEVAGILQNARGFLRHMLAERLQLRKTPDLQFEAAAEVDEAKLAALMKRVRRGRPRE